MILQYPLGCHRSSTKMKAEGKVVNEYFSLLGEKGSLNPFLSNSFDQDIRLYLLFDFKLTSSKSMSIMLNSAVEKWPPISTVVRSIAKWSASTNHQFSDSSDKCRNVRDNIRKKIDQPYSRLSMVDKRQNNKHTRYLRNIFKTSFSLVSSPQPCGFLKRPHTSL